MYFETTYYKYVVSRVRAASRRTPTHAPQHAHGRHKIVQIAQIHQNLRYTISPAQIYDCGRENMEYVS